MKHNVIKAASASRGESDNANLEISTKERETHKYRRAVLEQRYSNQKWLKSWHQNGGSALEALKSAINLSCEKAEIVTEKAFACVEAEGAPYVVVGGGKALRRI